MGQSSPVMARFTDLGLVRVAAIYWGVVAAPQGPNKVFRDFKHMKVPTNT